MRKIFVGTSILVLGGVAAAAVFWPPALASLILFIPLITLGMIDLLQTKQAVKRNFPLIGRFRYMFEAIRPEIQQYFIESDTDGVPFSRELRSLVYQRAKNVRDTIPFGTQHDTYRPGYEWISHSIAPKPVFSPPPRVLIGKLQCSKPYEASMLNISAMSYGSLSSRAVTALNLGAKEGGFYHNTGEGGLSPYHLMGGDVVWQLGTGYFGARDRNGRFDAANFKERATLPTVKMIEVKLSQGAKPGHGGILPGPKCTPEIAKIRGVEPWKTVHSPPAHTAFTTPRELLEFLAKLRELSGGKPVGFKLCVGKKREFLAICKAMIETKLYPDFITVDGAEGGTGAAPLEFSDSVGMPLQDGLVFVRNCLAGAGLRDKTKIIASGKIITGFHMASKIALGADLCNSARGMMFAIGCIQALRCNANTCPTGVTTQDPELMRGLVVADKAPRVHQFHKNTVQSFLELLAAAGLSHPSELRPWHVYRRISHHEIRHYDQIFDFLKTGAFLDGQIPNGYELAWKNASASTFEERV